ncbi:MAG: hypothetical protein M3495_19930 [Pseudomonadota bacterium]|nr:hypothetical protein [Gammaproteobacteria bacterium]MDQ3583726.1 hypothetical protein [Pseudomonadota bacterium]
MEQDNLIGMLLREANRGNYVNLLIILGVIIVPVVAAWVSKWLTNRKIARLYEARLKDKDAEIARLAVTVKNLENKLLETKRP